MRPLVLAAAALASLGIAMAGCAALEGLSSISEQACAPDCDGGASADGVAPAPGEDGATSGLDVATSDDTTLPDDTTTPPLSDDSPAGEDAPASDDAPSTADASDSAVADAGEDSGPTPPVDSGADTGCGPLDTTTNCSACSATCVATNGTSPTCNGTTCSYTCNSTYLDCNKAITPDLDGCECKGPPGATQAACCGTGCPIAHNYNENITGATFYDCVAAGTYNVTLAMDACIAFTGNAAFCTSGYYCPQFPDGGGTDLGDQVCSDGASTCDCWTYDGSLNTLVSIGTGVKGACYCPVSGTSPHWD